MASHRSRRIASAGSLFYAVAAAFAMACSSSSSGPSTSGDGGGSGDGMSASCTFLQDGVTECFTFADLTAAEAAKDDSNCTSTQPDGKVVNQCPSAGLIGCCEDNMPGLVVYSCTYEGSPGATASILESQCSEGKGTWSTSVP
jgi:hypothetical protein